MPWKQVKPMEEKYRFILRANEPKANFSEVCREFGISRKTGYKLFSRYEAEGLRGLKPRSRRPKVSPGEVSSELIFEIVSIRQAHPRWGGVTIRSILERTHDAKKLPCPRTIDRILDRCGLVESRKRRKKRKYAPTDIVKPEQPNDVWTVDFKGWWRTKDRRKCVPLTVRDEYSRYLLDLSALEHGSTEAVKARFKECFRKYGMPKYIRSDNGAPFSAYLGLQGLSSLSVWWIKQGVFPNRIPPASPQFNGAHERMHRDIKAELQKNPAKNSSIQQRIFDEWREEFNKVRPHRALKMKTPSEVYKFSDVKFQEELEFQYEQDFLVRKVTSRGGISWKSKDRFISNALAKERIGVEVEDDSSLSLWFCDFFLGNTDEDFVNPLGGSVQGRKVDSRELDN